MSEVPVITIDGTGGTGKGTISQMLARALGWHYLDSGALYRVLAYGALHKKVDISDEFALAYLAKHLDVRFITKEPDLLSQVVFEGQNITGEIRSEKCGEIASQIGSYVAVREALLDRQRSFRCLPGLVTDGRDMGTVIFPQASLKLFLTATLEERAKRRFLQLQANGVNVNLPGIQRELAKRDQRDASRAVAPLKPAKDAIQIDTTHMTIEQTFQRVFDLVKQHLTDV